MPPQNYKTLATDVNVDPYAAARTIWDVLNEPDARGLGWSDITPIYFSVMDAISAINPSALTAVCFVRLVAFRKRSDSPAPLPFATPCSAPLSKLVGLAPRVLQCPFQQP